jgi:hypothetical protein
MRKVKVRFNAVVENEVQIEKEIEITDEEYSDLVLCATEINAKEKLIHIDQITEAENEELIEMMLSITPDEMKKNCVSMVFTDIKVTQLN